MSRFDCAKSEQVRIMVMLAGSAMAITRSAEEWAEIFGLSWETVKKRRQRGDTWVQALGPLRRSSFNMFRGCR